MSSRFGTLFLKYVQNYIALFRAMAWHSVLFCVWCLVGCALIYSVVDCFAYICPPLQNSVSTYPALDGSAQLWVPLQRNESMCSVVDRCAGLRWIFGGYLVDLPGCI